MELLPLDKLGARQSATDTFDFGVLLPWVSAADGNKVRVEIFHERDQFLKSVPAQKFELFHSGSQVRRLLLAAQSAVLSQRHGHLGRRGRSS